MSRGFDPVSTNGKRLTPRERVQLLVVGAGPAGCAAALEAARLGLEVTLVDEHPLDPASMGLEVPFHFGGRMTGAVRNRNSMTEAILANDPALGEAFEAGVGRSARRRRLEPRRAAPRRRLGRATRGRPHRRQ